MDENVSNSLTNKGTRNLKDPRKTSQRAMSVIKAAKDLGILILWYLNRFSNLMNGRPMNERINESRIYVTMLLKNQNRKKMINPPVISNIVRVLFFIFHIISCCFIQS